MRVIALCLLLAGCMPMAPSVKTVPYPVSKWVSVPRTLTNDHTLPPMPERGDNNAMEASLTMCIAELVQANSDKARIRALPRGDE